LEAGSIYYHFDSKAEILSAVLDVGLRDMYEAVRETIGTLGEATDYHAKIEAAIETHLTHLLNRGAYSSVIVRNYSQLPSDLRKAHQPLRHAYIEMWENLLNKARDAGVIHSFAEVKPLRQFILGTLNWTVEWYDSDIYPIEVLADRAADVIMHGILNDNAVTTTKLPKLPGYSRKTKAGLGKSGRTRERILTHAAALFREKGWKATTLRDIAAAAEMQAGSIYYYYGSKEEILDAVLDRGLSDMHDGVKEIIDRYQEECDFRCTFEIAVREHLSWLMLYSDFSSATLRTYSQLPKEIRNSHRAARKAYAALWDKLLLEAESQGILREGLEVGPLRKFILGGLNWMVEWHGSAKYDFDLLSGRAARVLLDGACVRDA